ncbi:uncharacterized protein LOC131675231 [Phymastichus coffea]|uniref:uncharacterized protein LOC131675231 n=1 Tax=Phymastichus coffea TaxID=108790 RepID=UPI00273B37C6|nr:uncharacterized protein LOC131675231 [Phymastichus coffea]
MAQMLAATKLVLEAITTSRTEPRQNGRGRSHSRSSNNRSGSPAPNGYCYYHYRFGKKLASLPSIQAFHGSTSTSENRLHTKDRNSGLTFLVDSGSVVSLLPRSAVRSTEPLVKQELSLTAANMSPIATYGRIVLAFNLGLRREYAWPFVIGDITSAIIGADFLDHADLLPDLQNMRLVDSMTGLHAQG